MPWAATCTSRAGRAPTTSAAVAGPESDAGASAGPHVRRTRSTSSNDPARPGPARAARKRWCPLAGGGRYHRVADGATVTGTPRRLGSRPHGRDSRAAVGTTTTRCASPTSSRSERASSTSVSDTSRMLHRGDRRWIEGTCSRARRSAPSRLTFSTTAATSPQSKAAPAVCLQACRVQAIVQGEEGQHSGLVVERVPEPGCGHRSRGRGRRRPSQRVDGSTPALRWRLRGGPLPRAQDGRRAAAVQDELACRSQPGQQRSGRLIRSVRASCAR